MSKNTLVIGIVMAATLLALGLCSRSGRSSSGYESYAEAQADGAMEQGKWIPSFLPKSSRSIDEIHNNETNKQVITFDYTPGDLGALDTECDREGGSELVFTCADWKKGATVCLKANGTGELRTISP